MPVADKTGIDALFRLFKATGKRGLDPRKYLNHGSWHKLETFHEILGTIKPTESDNIELFGERARVEGISELRLIEVGLFAPCWAHFVEATIGWPSFVEAVEWLYAHRDREAKVDVSWFGRIRLDVSIAQWRIILDIARYRPHDDIFKRSLLFARTLLGEVREIDLLKSIRSYRHQDAIRALGLLPLPKEPSVHLREARDIWDLMTRFLGSSDRVGPERHANERKAVWDMIMNRLRASSDFFGDYPLWLPGRIEWLLEGENADKVVFHHLKIDDELQIEMGFSAVGRPFLTAKRNGKELSVIPI